MVEPVTDVEALISWLDDVGHNHSSGSVYANAATALRTLQERVKALSDRYAILEAAGRSVVARWDSPLWKDREPTAHVIERLRATLKGADQ